ncbi:hypothetical protein FW774_11890 [Pedobacter sp. BS3]|uniref:hypothetical protein n=1 Tax=Pedobacter sp. BS3 TaxID=2567937 RepID=UPI0011EC5A02|nr:hypothetical protein [Pedobacter sp. BS3]TZF82999.1 hypothetical protein FW774_11890 [Pedobacter sp. BS3]
MKPVYYYVFALIVSVCLTNEGFGQIVAWQFALPEPSTGREKTAAATTNHANLEQSVLSRGPGAVPKQGNLRGFSGNFPVNADQEAAKISGAYYQFTVKAKPGYQVSLSSLEATLRRQAESAHIYRWMYSLDGKTFKEIGDQDITITDLTNNGVKQPAISLTGYNDLQHVSSSKTITFRIYAWGGTATEGSARAFGFGKSDSKGSNALALDGTVSPVK